MEKTTLGVQLYLLNSLFFFAPGQNCLHKTNTRTQQMMKGLRVHPHYWPNVLGNMRILSHLSQHHMGAFWNPSYWKVRPALQNWRNNFQNILDHIAKQLSMPGTQLFRSNFYSTTELWISNIIPRLNEEGILIPFNYRFPRKHSAKNSMSKLWELELDC